MLTPYLKKHDTQIREAILVDKKLAFVQHRLGFRNHVSKSSNYLDLLPALSLNLHRKFVKFVKF